MIDPKFVAEHKDEIERCAYQVYLARERYCQIDEPAKNFLRAVEIVYERYCRVPRVD